MRTAWRWCGWSRLAAGLGGLMALTIGAFGQFPPEEEDPRGGVKKRIIVDDEDSNNPGAVAGTPPHLRLDELLYAAQEAKHPTLKELYQKHTVPFDRLYTKGGKGPIRPIEYARGNALPEMTVTLLNAEGQETGSALVNSSIVRRVEYFEEIVVTEANKLLAYKPFGTTAGPEGLTVAEQLTAAEKLLAAALRFHDFSRERLIRKGKGWDEIRQPLADRLREVRLLQLKTALAANDWPTVREVGQRLLRAYPRDAGVASEVAAARILEAQRLLASDQPTAPVKAREILDELEARYPGGGGEAIKEMRKKLTSLAQDAFRTAQTRKKAGDLAGAARALDRAAALDPTLPELREMLRELKSGYQTLSVGVREYPVWMSPMTARLDSEKQAVELLFEGLLTEVPDRHGGLHYRPGAALIMPRVIPGGREIALRSFELDASGRFGFESHDVVETVKWMQKYQHTWSGYMLSWMDELPTPLDTTTLRVTFRQGHPDPRALLTFKLLPARWLTANRKTPDDAVFAESPFGTGPYRLYSNSKAIGNTPREMVFIDNPLYSRWRDRADLPHIREIRFVETAKVPNLVEWFQQGRLHILTDVPTAELDRFLNPAANLTNIVQAYTAETNRRIYLLAINHRRPYLQNSLLRQGISLAIDREAILDAVFRAKTKFHTALTGPFPPKSWATPKGPSGTPIPLLNRDGAFTRLQAYLADNSTRDNVTLSYPANDALAAQACQMIKTQVESLFNDLPGRKLTIQLEAVPPRDLILRVEEEHRYDLAYVPFEYPDDWYPLGLGAFLDSTATDRGGRNWLGFGKQSTEEADTRLEALLRDLRGYRDFQQLAAKAGEVHRLFNEVVPFIPLWQLDRHLLVHKRVKIYTDLTDQPVSPRVLNPTTLFQGIAYWRMEE
ncbi:MAG: ABC transporter substrate-binding protein [Gemmataceae bacterium]|nr:ABC transporter substrate-binding protein [Gemmata sp.]MDW8198371.1 ABC transporter substrate-binding protein [Gemmataceae bacterium]